jgi:LemA protein
MRIAFLFSFLTAFVTPADVFGQDTSLIINASWAKLKTEFQHRTDIISVLAKNISKSKKVDKKDLKNTRTLSADFFQYLDTLKLLDNSSVSVISQKDKNLMKSIAKLFVLLESDGDYMRWSNTGILIGQLRGVENKIARARSEYSGICRTYNRADLCLIATSDAERPPVN